jgi:hypothetical protein
VYNDANQSIASGYDRTHRRIIPDDAPVAPGDLPPSPPGDDGSGGDQVMQDEPVRVESLYPTLTPLRDSPDEAVVQRKIINNLNREIAALQRTADDMNATQQQTIETLKTTVEEVTQDGIVKQEELVRLRDKLYETRNDLLTASEQIKNLEEKQRLAEAQARVEKMLRMVRDTMRTSEGAIKRQTRSAFQSIRDYGYRRMNQAEVERLTAQLAQVADEQQALVAQVDDVIQSGNQQRAIELRDRIVQGNNAATDMGRRLGRYAGQGGAALVDQVTSLTDRALRFFGGIVSGAARPMGNALANSMTTAGAGLRDATVAAIGMGADATREGGRMALQAAQGTGQVLGAANEAYTTLAIELGTNMYNGLQRALEDQRESAAAQNRSLRQDEATRRILLADINRMTGLQFDYQGIPAQVLRVVRNTIGRTTFNGQTGDMLRDMRARAVMNFMERYRAAQDDQQPVLAIQDDQQPEQPGILQRIQNIVGFRLQAPPPGPGFAGFGRDEPIAIQQAAPNNIGAPFPVNAAPAAAKRTTYQGMREVIYMRRGEQTSQQNPFNIND